MIDPSKMRVDSDDEDDQDEFLRDSSLASAARKGKTYGDAVSVEDASSDEMDPKGMDLPGVDKLQQDVKNAIDGLDNGTVYKN